MERFVYTIEGLNVWVGRAFGWCILILTLSVSYEVFVRYVLNAPTVWSMDMMIQMYGALFLMAGPYALAQDAHVRGDFLYRLLKPKTQGKIDLVLSLPITTPTKSVIALRGWLGGGVGYIFSSHKRAHWVGRTPRNRPAGTYWYAGAEKWPHV